MPENKIISHDDLIDYFQDICNKHKLLNPDEVAVSPRFYAFKESFAGIQMKSPSLVLIPTQFGIRDNGSDNIHLTAQVDFMICCSGSKDNDTLNKQMLELSFGICWDVVTRIKDDNRNFAQSNGRYINQFDPNTVQIEEFPPFGTEYMIGYKVSFQFLNPKSIIKVPANWYS